MSERCDWQSDQSRLFYFLNSREVHGAPQAETAGYPPIRPLLVRVVPFALTNRLHPRQSCTWACSASQGTRRSSFGRVRMDELEGRGQKKSQRVWSGRWASTTDLNVPDTARQPAPNSVMST
jgi:hypothetical protein